MILNFRDWLIFLIWCALRCCMTQESTYGQPCTGPVCRTFSSCSFMRVCTNSHSDSSIPNGSICPSLDAWKGGETWPEGPDLDTSFFFDNLRAQTAQTHASGYVVMLGVLEYIYYVRDVNFTWRQKLFVVEAFVTANYFVLSVIISQHMNVLNLKTCHLVSRVSVFYNVCNKNANIFPENCVLSLWTFLLQTNETNAENNVGVGTLFPLDAFA